MTSFVAMGTEVTLLAPGLGATAEARLADEVADVFAAAEARFSRFRPESELSRLNRSEGAVSVSAELFEALQAARVLHTATDGLFDPAVGGALVAHGYDRTWAPGALDRRQGPTFPPSRARFADVQLDARARTVRRPPGMTLDLGGLLKGRTVDHARAMLPIPGALDAGGDAALVGVGPDRRGWIVDVEDPRDAGRVLLSLRVSNASVATSADNRRAWRMGAERAHHLVDPRTQRPAESDLLQVTAVADTTALADVLAKVIFVAGACEAERWLARLGGHGAVMVDRHGEPHVLGDLRLDDAEQDDEAHRDASEEACHA